MDPDQDLLQRVARLARLDLSPEEQAELGPQFGRILTHFETLASVPVDGLRPLAAPELETEGLRADEERPSWPRERLLEGAPEPLDGHYGVPKTVGGEG